MAQHRAADQPRGRRPATDYVPRHYAPTGRAARRAAELDQLAAAAANDLYAAAVARGDVDG